MWRLKKLSKNLSSMCWVKKTSLSESDVCSGNCCSFCSFHQQQFLADFAFRKIERERCSHFSLLRSQPTPLFSQTQKESSSIFSFIFPTVYETFSGVGGEALTVSPLMFVWQVSASDFIIFSSQSCAPS